MTSMMGPVLWTTVAVVTLLTNLAVHEAMHAVALREVGGRIQSAGLGLPFKPMLTLPPTHRRPWTFTLSPWLLGAYVEPDEHSTKLLATLSYRQRAYFAGAGVAANLVLAGLAFAVVFLIRGSLLWAGIGVVFAIATWLGRRLITYAMPVLGLAAAVFIGYALVGAVGEPQGPVGVAKALASDNGLDVAIVAFGVAASLALFNMIPIYPLDGGRVMDAAIDTAFGGKAAGRYRVATGLFCAALFIYVLGTDLWSLIP